MLLALDVGNTNITLGVFRDKKLIFTARLSTDFDRTEDQYAVDIMSLLRLYGLDGCRFTGAIMSSVVPSLDLSLRRATEKVAGVSPIQVGPGIKTGMDIRIDNPAQLGADLLVGAVAAVARYGAPCIVWDLGTATTVFTVDKNGCFCGGAILAGVLTALDSLTARASLLPRISLTAPAKVIGTNTIACMQSGVIYGAAAMMDGMCDRMERELGYPVTVVATGGLAGLIAPHCSREVKYEENLLLEGLCLLYEKNK